MSLNPATAARILRARLGATINPVQKGAGAGRDNDKVLGFASSRGRVLALNRKIKDETHIWFEEPSPVALFGVTLKKTAKNDDLNGRLAVLYPPKGLQAVIDSEAALDRFLNWYDPASASPVQSIDSAEARNDLSYRPSPISPSGEAADTASEAEGSEDAARRLSIIDMRVSVLDTVKNSNGQTVQRVVKNKELRMTVEEFEKETARLLDV